MKNKINQSLYQNDIKMIAIVVMTMNHIANMFLDNGLLKLLLIGIGYSAAPIMCYFLVEGYYHTHSQKRYGLRIAACGIVALVPFVLASGQMIFNMMFTLLIGIAILNVRHSKINKGVKVVVIVALFLISSVCDWGLFGPGLIMALDDWYLGYNTKSKIYICIITVLFAASNGLGFSMLGNSETYSILGALLTGVGIPLGIVIIRCFYNGTRKADKRSQDGNRFFYIYYPVHLLVLYYIKMLISS